LLHATELRLAKGKLAPADAAAILDSLRYRWRGDGNELETVRALGHIYLSQGRYREALEALRSAGQRSPDQPASMAVSNDLSAAFRALFLDGQADGLQPIQALALFYDFRELTPIGTDGDLMVRKMVRRMVDVDLLDQAASLLKWQVDNRLDGLPKAQISTDLATIDLMNKRPEDALDAINNSRTTLLPTALNARRRVVEARALLALGRGDHALELLEGDKSSEAADVRAEASWGQHSWAQAGALIEGQLGDRWKRPEPLSGEDQGRLLRAGVAYSLAGDDSALTRLRTRYARLAEASNAPDALRVALAGVQAGALSAGDFARAASDAAAFGGWVAANKKRFHDQLAAPLTVPAVQPVKQTAARPAADKPPVKKS
jgi:tetratricopeptide (TPR) repeat protein